MTIGVRIGVTLGLLALAGDPAAWQQAAQPASAAEPLTASVRVDATTVANRIGPQLYGHFLEFMFEGIKFGLHAELLKNRGFEEAAGVTGLPRDWEREPNDRTTIGRPPSPRTQASRSRPSRRPGRPTTRTTRCG
jgi:hypothetical protein